jgi:hypothetical protein
MNGQNTVGRPIGQLFGLTHSVLPAALPGMLGLFGVIALIGLLALGMSIGTALVFAFVCVVLHIDGGLLHHYGHAIAARSTGYPMTGVTFGIFGVLARSEYPADEPALSGRIHIRRALGGPILSGVVTLVLAGLLAIPGLVGGEALRPALQFALFEGIAVYSLGALFPLGFNDGSTILRWWGKP